MSAAVVDDILSLIGLSIMIPIAINVTGATAQTIEFGEVALILLKVLLFFGVISFIGMVLFTAFVFGVIADKFGFHPAIGAYFAGLFLREEYFVIEVDNEIRSYKRDGEFVFQVFSAAFAARFTGGYQWHQSVMVGLGMLGRAEFAFIVIDMFMQIIIS